MPSLGPGLREPLGDRPADPAHGADFPARRDEPWLLARGLAIASVVCLLACFVAWFAWTQVFLPRTPGGSAYKVPLLPRATALAVILGLVAGSLTAVVPSLMRRPLRAGPQPWQVGMAAFLLALPWFVLIFVAYGCRASLPVIVPLALGLLWAAGSSCPLLDVVGAPRMERILLSGGLLGMLAGSMLAGYPLLRAMGAPAVDWIGKILFNSLAVLLLTSCSAQFGVVNLIPLRTFAP